MTDYTKFENETKTETTETTNTNETSGAQPPDSLIGFVTGCKKLNIRKNPAVNPSNVITVVGVDTPLLVINPEKATKEWYKVELEDGTVGFCMKEFVKVD